VADGVAVGGIGVAVDIAGTAVTSVAGDDSSGGDAGGAGVSVPHPTKRIPRRRAAISVDRTVKQSLLIDHIIIPKG
jgi:hypothetical protein